MVNPQAAEHVEPDPLTSANLERLATSPSGTRSAPSTMGRHQDRAPFSRKLTKSLFLRPAHLIGPAPSYLESLKSALTYSYINVLLVFNPIAWALHYTHQNAGATFAIALLGIVPLAGLLGHGTETIAMYTGDALGGLINASLGNATEFIIAILLLVKCELRVVQASLLGGLLSNLLLVTGMAFLVGGFRFNELEFQQTAAQLNTSLMTLAVIALVLPTVFAFAIETASGEDQERRLILEMSRGASLILILIYISYMVFQLYSHSYLYNPDAEYEIRSDSSSSSSSSSSRSSSPAPAVTAGHQLSPTIEKAEPQMDTKEEPVSGPAATPAAPAAANASAATPVTPTSSRRPHVHMRASDRPPVSAGTRPAQLVPPRIAPRRANSLPFGSAAALGRGNREPIHPMNGAESEKARELQMRSRNLNRGPRPAADKPLDPEAQRYASTQHEIETPEMNMTTAILVLVATTGLTYLTAEALTDALEQIGNSGSISKEWLGLILLAIVGNAAEHVTAVFVAYRNKVDLSLAVSVGSCIQIALFVIPLLVIIGWIADKPLSLLFDPLEVVTLFLSVLLVRFATEDGRTHYMSGVTLFGSYVLIAFAFWYYPNSGTSAGQLFDETCSH